MDVSGGGKVKTQWSISVLGHSPSKVFDPVPSTHMNIHWSRAASSILPLISYPKR